MASTGPKLRRELLVIGAQFTGTFVAREMKAEFDVTIVDAKEYFEYTPGILRAYVQPAHYEALSFLLEPVLAERMGVRFILGEVTKLEAQGVSVKPLLGGQMLRLSFDYCIVCSGCNFGPYHKLGESLWAPTIHEAARLESQWDSVDERFLEGRKQHILQEHEAIRALNERKAKVLVVGAGFIGVEWVTDLNYFFRDLDLTVIDFLPRCLGPLPDKAAEYCAKYMQAAGIKERYGVKYNPDSQMFWDQIGMRERADRIDVCIGVKACNYFMPSETLSDRGPGGGGWIHFNTKLQVTKRPLQNQPVGDLWGGGRVFAVGDCNYGGIGTPPQWVMPPVPKVSYPGEEQAFHACKNVRLLDAQLTRTEGAPPVGDLKDTWWPWGAGMFATSLGKVDGCFVVGANHTKGSGVVLTWGWLSSFQKDFIEKTKMMECKDRCFGKMVWHFVHRMPVNLWGKGPLFP
uniref:FAD/NAD(P)-binding domain-containing protein n=1 Tax=Pyrodinium bahamense TaxID=73915 RepID=A0A7S0FWV1_9DINO